MDSASEKGALLQGLCPGISCVFNPRVQLLFDWMTVKWFLSVNLILPPVWQQVLRLRLQDNMIISLFVSLPHLPGCSQPWQNCGTKTLNKEVGGKKGEIWQDPFRHWNKQNSLDACNSRTPCKTPCSQRCLQTTWVLLATCHSNSCCMQFLVIPSLANLETIQNCGTWHEGGGRIIMKCRVSSQRDVRRRRVLQTKYRIRNTTSHKVHPAAAWMCRLTLCLHERSQVPVFWKDLPVVFSRAGPWVMTLFILSPRFVALAPVTFV